MELVPSPVIDEQTEQSLLSGDMSHIVSDIVKENSVPFRICCPFCLIDFGYEELLKDHIKESHARELKYVHRAKPGELDFYECPFCTAKFYSTELLPKHIIRKHELCVLNMFSGFSPEKYVYCRFCPHKILRKHYKLLMIHIEKKHFQQFEKYILLKYCNLSKSLEDLVGASDQPIYDVPIQPSQECVSDTPTSPRPILKSKTAYPLEESECLENDRRMPNYANLNARSGTCPQRKLRFNLPESPENKENKAGKKRKVHMPNLKNLVSKKAKVTDSPLSPSQPSGSDRPLHQFKCGLCSEAFDLNEQLIDHLKSKHRGLSFRAQYKCGLCSAKFYRNSYLVRHCWHHHAPLCLKTPVGGKYKSKVSQF
ncbi:hypothetical protein GE061_004662 [Apolygus lucorum]|uniref:C2H2-type domain-containing protein n=1 Tax=Apolygus lucorum TaxID=248454 RepID=A0A8S9X1B5_APOLU|nr:hypothetical protein GE061_004662 [Apolygus lucorum]